MNYTEMLNMLIDKSGKMLKEIAEECQKDGINLTNTYLSSLKTTPGKIASDDISRAIAKACNAKYVDVLVVQAYLDKAPAIIIEYLEAQIAMMSIFQQAFMQNMQEHPEVLEIIKGYQEYSLAEMICETIENIRDADSVEEFINAINANQEEEPQCMVIYPEQLKNIKFVNESDLRKLMGE